MLGVSNVQKEQQGTLAERVGFEPTVPVLLVRSFSKGVLSATQPPLQLPNCVSGRIRIETNLSTQEIQEILPEKLLAGGNTRV